MLRAVKFYLHNYMHPLSFISIFFRKDPLLTIQIFSMSALRKLVLSSVLLTLGFSFHLQAQVQLKLWYLWLQLYTSYFLENLNHLTNLQSADLTILSLYSLTSLEGMSTMQSNMDNLYIAFCPLLKFCRKIFDHFALGTTDHRAVQNSMLSTVLCVHFRTVLN